jgi:hypothetical protein
MQFLDFNAAAYKKQLRITNHSKNTFVKQSYYEFSLNVK